MAIAEQGVYVKSAMIMILDDDPDFTLTADMTEIDEDAGTVTVELTATTQRPSERLGREESDQQGQESDQAEIARPRSQGGTPDEIRYLLKHRSAAVIHGNPLNSTATARSAFSPPDYVSICHTETA